MQESIIHRARQGDQRAFQQLVESYHDVVWRTARVLLPDANAAEDALQEAWLDTWRGLRHFNDRQEFRPWLLTIVANRCRMAMRRRTISTVPIEVADEERLISADDVAKTILDAERASELQIVLKALPVEQQHVLELRFFAELELAEIALVLHVPLGTVKSRLHRALGNLRESKKIELLDILNTERAHRSR
ncbi:MAG TPA: sigma-70 family RNA polymerase sigma factor [Ktedonobacteraceae bacterium]|nr:sigma-70 family RNA polymerase sigma factor [Ktedonobacteraceae bacterium]